MDATLRKGSGFTLIELLVVIAIIGVLSAVVLASLQSARSKGGDAAAKHALEGTRSQGELFFYVNGNSYSTICTSAGVNNVKGINAQVLSAAQAVGLSSVNTTYGTAGPGTTATCHDSATAWAAEVPLKSGGMFCVDSVGSATTTSGSTLGASDAACGP
jgi:type IV pilus assembly protein PilA